MENSGQDGSKKTENKDLVYCFVEQFIENRHMPEDPQLAADVISELRLALANEFGSSPHVFTLAEKYLQKRFPIARAVANGKEVWCPVGGFKGLGPITVCERIDYDEGGSHVFKMEASGNKVVAVKVAKEGIRSIDIARLLIQRRATMPFDHPNVVRVYEIQEYVVIGDERRKLAIVQELIKGVTLSRALKTQTANAGETAILDKKIGGIEWCEVNGSKRRVFTPRRAAEIVGNVAEVLAYLYGTGEVGEEKVMHLDLKPSNVMIRTEDDRRGKEGSVVLIDFGSASVDDDTLGGLTKCYIPTEKLKDMTAEPSPKWDVFNLGGLLFFLLTGDDPPEDGSTPIPKRLQGIDPVLLKILQKCRAEDPDQRYPLAEDVARDLRDWYFDRPVQGVKAHYAWNQRLQLLLIRCRELGWWSDVSKVHAIAAVAIGLLGIVAFFYSVIIGPFTQRNIDACGALHTLEALAIAIASLLLLRARTPHRYHDDFKNPHKWYRSLGLTFPLVAYLIAMVILRLFISDRSSVAIAQLLMSAMTTLLIGLLPGGFFHSLFACGGLLVSAIVLTATGYLRTTTSPDMIAFIDSGIQSFSQAFYFFILAHYAWTIEPEMIPFTRHQIKVAPQGPDRTASAT